MASSTIFQNFNQPIEKRSLILLMKDIIEGKYKDNIEPIRMALGMGKTDRADKLKRQLPAFTPSGVFEGGRKIEYLKMYSGYVHLDFDKMTDEELSNAREKLKEIPYTFAYFISPSGNGLKVFIEIDTDVQHHDLAYKQVQHYYEKELGIEADPKCKDITRLCFVSYDPHGYKNIQNQKFKVEVPAELRAKVEPPKPIQKPTNQEPDSNVFYETIFDDCIAFTENKEAYVDGNRNNFIYQLACNCNRRGIPEDEAQHLIGNKYDLNNSELTGTIRSAYNHNAQQFAQFANVTKPKEQSIPTEDFLKATPQFDGELFANLPDILKDGCQAFTDPRERDVFLTGALAILSGCLPNVCGIYAQQTVYPNLYAFIIAPAASGKSALKFAKQLADKYQDDLLEQNKQAEAQYNNEMAEYKAAKSALKKGETFSQEEPDKPPFQVAFIPANCSYSKILAHIQQNEGKGIICETEADSMGIVFKQEWGGYSDLLRKAYHHETVSLSRKTDNEYISIKEPKLSVALSGTPGQVANLISSAEDGLFSRFLFYAFKVEQIWKDVSPYGNPMNLDYHFTKLSTSVFDMIQFFNQSKTEVILTHSQWKTLNITGQQWLNEITLFTAEEAGSVAKRLGVILFRIAMIFTSLRKFENGEMTEKVECTDADFELALHIANVYLQHSILMFNNLPKQEESGPFKGANNKKKFFEALPQKFKREEAIQIGSKHNLKSRTTDNLLKDLCEKGLLDRPEYGHYQRVAVS